MAGYNGRSGDIVGVVTYKNREDKDMIRTIVQLEKFTGVTAKDFFESQGDLYVSVNGQNYRVADNAECYGGMAGNPHRPRQLVPPAQARRPCQRHQSLLQQAHRLYRSHRQAGTSHYGGLIFSLSHS